MSIKIEKWKKDRTLDQNALLWKFYEIIGNEIGNNPNDLHEFLKCKLLPPRFITVMGKTIKIPATTTTLSTTEFTKYINDIELLTGIPLNQDLC